MTKIIVTVLGVLMAAGLSCFAQTKPLPDLKEVRALYPDLSDDDFKIKLNGAQDSFHFLRTFVPLYYTLIKEFPAPELSNSAVDSFSGLCVGDAHPENFGILLSDAGVPIFTMNDIDDGGPCPIAADMLRFLVAVKLFDSKQDIEKLIESYGSGLNGDQIKLSDVVDKMAKDAKGETDPDGKLKDGGKKFKRDDGVDEVGRKEQEALQTVVTQVYGVNATVLDAIKMKKASGGSGGLLRYRTLIEFTAKGVIQLLEFKEIQRPGIFPVATGPIGDPQSRLTSLIELEEGGDASSLFSIKPVLGRDMLLRPRRLGNLGITLDDLKKSNLPDVLNDEIAMLGRIHIRSVTKLDDYRKSFAAISKKDWRTVVERYADMMQKIYKDLN